MSSSEGTETTPSVEPKQLRVFPSRNGQLQSDCDDQNCHLTLKLASYNGDAGLVKSLLEMRAMLSSMIATTSILGQITAALEYQHAFDCVVPSEEPGRTAVLNAVAGRTPLTCAVDGGHTAVVGLTHWGWGIAYAAELGFPQFVWGKSLGMECGGINFQSAVLFRTSKYKN